MDNIHLPDQTHIGYAHLLTADMDRALRFYSDLMGFQVLKCENGQATLSADLLFSPLIQRSRSSAKHF